MPPFVHSLWKGVTNVQTVAIETDRFVLDRCSGIGLCQSASNTTRRGNNRSGPGSFREKRISFEFVFRWEYRKTTKGAWLGVAPFVLNWYGWPEDYIAADSFPD